MTERSEQKDGLLTRAFRAVSDWAGRHSVNVYLFDGGCCFSGRSVASVLSAENEGITYVSSPVYADVLAVSGALSRKAAPVLRRMYEQMPEPRGVIVLGACACGGGLFADSYAVIADVSSVVPVDAFVPGCPVAAADFRLAIRRLFDEKKKEAV